MRLQKTALVLAVAGVMVFALAVAWYYRIEMFDLGERRVLLLHRWTGKIESRRIGRDEGWIVEKPAFYERDLRPTQSSSNDSAHDLLPTPRMSTDDYLDLREAAKAKARAMTGQPPPATPPSPSEPRDPATTDWNAWLSTTSTVDATTN